MINFKIIFEYLDIVFPFIYYLNIKQLLLERIKKIDQFIYY